MDTTPTEVTLKLKGYRVNKSLHGPESYPVYGDNWIDGETQEEAFRNYETAVLTQKMTVALAPVTVCLLALVIFTWPWLLVVFAASVFAAVTLFSEFVLPCFRGPRS